MDRLQLHQGDSKQSTTSGAKGRSKKADRPTKNNRSSSRSRDVLPFPQGGVFALVASNVSHRVETALEAARGIERTLDRMQSQLNELETELNDPYVFPLARIGATDPNETRPLAA